MVSLSNHEGPQRIIGAAGCALIIAGVFLPFTHLVFADVNALQRGPGVLLLALAVIGFALVALRRYPWLALCGAGSLVLLWSHFVTLQQTRVFGNNPTGGPHVNNGFWVGVFGAVLLLVAAFTSSRRPTVSS